MTESPVGQQVTVAPKTPSSSPILESSPSPRPFHDWKPTKPHYGLSPKQKHKRKEPKKKHADIFHKQSKGSFYKGYVSKSKKGKKSSKNYHHNGYLSHGYYQGHYKDVAIDHKKSWKKHGTDA
jgi:hypothetical protein